MNIKLLSEKIKELQYNVCEDRKTIVKRSPLWRTIRIIGGGAIVTTNVAADSVIGCLVSAYSATLGGFIVGKGLDG